MTIGVFISPAHPVPPDPDKILAPWVLTGDLVDGLVERGHTVHLYASKESRTSGILHDFGREPLVRHMHEFPYSEYRKRLADVDTEAFSRVLSRVDEDGIEVLHIQQPIELLYPQLSDPSRTVPCVMTFHDPITPDRWEMLAKIRSLPGCYYAGLSKAQGRGAPFPVDEIVPNGLSPTLFAFNGELSRIKRFIALGRIMPQKGYTDAIAAIHRTDGVLHIAGMVYPQKPESMTLFQRDIEPNIDNKRIFFEPVIAHDHLTGHYQTASALLFPIHWEEPFGMVMIEAMSCGTPVIAYNRGSVPEVVEDGVTGFIVDEDDTPRPGTGSWIIKKRGVDGLVEAMNRIGEIDRRNCRRRVERLYTVERMVEGYERLYARIRRTVTPAPKHEPVYYGFAKA